MKMIPSVRATEPGRAQNWNHSFNERLNCNQDSLNTEPRPTGLKAWLQRVIAPYVVFQSKVVSTRVGLLGTAALRGRYNSSKAKYGWETDSEQVL